MSSLIGRRLLHHEIGRLPGKGGMGEVYLAKDNELGRNVALEVLPPTSRTMSSAAAVSIARFAPSLR